MVKTVEKILSFYRFFNYFRIGKKGLKGFSYVKKNIHDLPVSYEKYLTLNALRLRRVI